MSAVVVDFPLVPVTATNGALGRTRRSRQNSSMSPITSTAAARASPTDQCGAGWVSGTPGASTSAAIRDQSTCRRSAVGMPEAVAFATVSALSSQPTTSAPPAKSALAPASPEPPRPNTATFLPAKLVTGIMATRRRCARDAPSRKRESEQTGPRRHSGAPRAASPESITTGGEYGFRPGPSGRPGMTTERLAQSNWNSPSQQKVTSISASTAPPAPARPR